jgi:hypothetical protein
MSELKDKLAATIKAAEDKAEKTKEVAKTEVIKAYTRRGFQFKDGFIRPDRLLTVIPKNEEEAKYIKEVLIPSGLLYVAVGE